ncbi:MAG TPA: energy transducer TonB, partial [Vicinamibacterales bacterium]|nr:energy transducer TonB [Vicinamibacterales bacterium]
GASPRPLDLVALQARLAVLRAEQESLAQRLNERHPDRLRNQQQIAELEAAIDRVKATLVNGGTTRSIGPGFTTQTPIRVGGAVRAPTRTKNVAPEYPAIAQSSRVQGIVIVEATIDEQGRIAEARILRSIPLLDQAALDAEKQWEYTPTLLNGMPVPVIMTVTVNFTLDPAPGQ